MNKDLFLIINGWASEYVWLDAIMVSAATWLIFVMAAVVAACFGSLVYRKQYKNAAKLALSLLASFVLMTILEHLVFHIRPFVHWPTEMLIPHEADNAFPSAHTTASIALALSVLVFTRYKLIGGLLLAAGLLVSFSRIFVGVHDPNDVLAGIGVAVLGASLVWLISELWPKHRHTETSAKI